MYKPVNVGSNDAAHVIHCKQPQEDTNEYKAVTIIT